MRLRNTITRITLTTLIVLLVGVVAFYSRTISSLSLIESLEVWFSVGILSFIAIYGAVSRSQYPRTINRKLQNVSRSLVAKIRNRDKDTPRADSKSLLGAATPLTDSDRRYEGTQYRPYEVLKHMDRTARENLFEDAWTQTLEMWKNRRPEAYALFVEHIQTDNGKFKPECVPDDEGQLRLRIVPVLDSSDNPDLPDDELSHLVGELQSDYHDRIVELACLHDSIEP